MMKTQAKAVALAFLCMLAMGSAQAASVLSTADMTAINTGGVDIVDTMKAVITGLIGLLLSIFAIKQAPGFVFWLLRKVTGRG
jgi:hypothetical protein